MPFKAFGIPKQPPQGGNCMARIREAEGRECYCQEPSVDGGRCSTHRTERLTEARRQQTQAVESADARLARSRYKQLAKDPSNIVELDRDILELSAMIDVLQEKDPIGHADEIRRMKETKAKLVETLVRVEPQVHQIVLTFTQAVWGKVQDIFEDAIPDDAKRRAARQQMETFLHHWTLPWWQQRKGRIS